MIFYSSSQQLLTPCSCLSNRALNASENGPGKVMRIFLHCLRSWEKLPLHWNFAIKHCVFKIMGSWLPPNSRMRLSQFVWLQTGPWNKERRSWRNARKPKTDLHAMFAKISLSLPFAWCRLTKQAGNNYSPGKRKTGKILPPLRFKPVRLFARYKSFIPFPFVKRLC